MYGGGRVKPGGTIALPVTTQTPSSLPEWAQPVTIHLEEALDHLSKSSKAWEGKSQKGRNNLPFWAS